MTREYFSIERDGFYGTYYPCRSGSEYMVIMQIGDNTDDILAKAGVKFAHELGVNVLAMSPDRGSYAFHDFPIERYGMAIEEGRKRGNCHFAIMGASTTGMTSLVAASYYPEITLTIALTPSDWIMEGYYRGKRDGCGEWPGNGRESTLSWKGRPLPFMPFSKRHPDYYQSVVEEGKRNGDMFRSRPLFDESEGMCTDMEACRVRTEDIKGHVVFVGAEDDALWDTCRYIRRIDEHLKKVPHECTYEIHTFEKGTHFVFPERMFRKICPGSGTLMTFIAFKAGREYPKECLKTRREIDRILENAIKSWMDA